MSIRNRPNVHSAETRAANLEKYGMSLTRELVVSILKRECPSLKPPGATELAVFRANLELMRASIGIERDLNKPSHDRNESVHAAIAALQTKIPAMMDSVRTNIAAFENIRSSLDLEDAAIGQVEDRLVAGQGKLTCAQRLLDDLDAFSQLYLFPTNPKQKFLDHWKTLLPRLVQHYQKALRPMNPNAPLQVHENGPGARFIAELIPYLTGESVKASTVGQTWSKLKPREG